MTQHIGENLSLFPELEPRQLLVRNEWLEACQFHDLTQAEVLREVARRVSELRATAHGNRALHPLVLLDLDSTLYEVGTRTHQILREWVASPESSEFPKVRPIIERVEATHLGYSLKDTFSAVGLSLQDAETEAAWKSAKRFWQRRFFTSEYLKYDLVYQGAPEFVRELYELGAELVYLTGRDEPGMGEGTRRRLIEDGFPFSVERTHLLMKPAFEMDDLQHKRNAADYVRRHGTLVASFENEPLNLVSLSEIFPDAMHVLLQTAWSDRPAPVARGLYRIAGFSR